MVKFECIKGMVKTEVAGGFIEVSGEIGVLINEVYSQISNADKRTGEMFKLMIKALATDESPVWMKNKDSKDCTITKIDVNKLIKQMREDKP